MLHFLSSLFSAPAERSGGVDAALLDKAIERAVDGTDRRIRAVGNYRKRLAGAVEQAVRHVIALVDSLPQPVLISPPAFSDDPRLRAFFISPDHLREVLGNFNNARDYLQGLAAPPPDEIFGLLAMDRQESNVFATEIEGENRRSDVMQVAVSFSNHRYLGPSGKAEDTRRELKLRAFDFLIQKALEQLSGKRGKRQQLDRQRQLLQRKLAAMQAGQWGLGDSSNAPPPDLAKLEAEIEAIETELAQAGSDKPGLEESLSYVAEIFSHAADWIALRPLKLRLDYRGIVVAASSPASELELAELCSSLGGETRVVLLGRIARADIPAPKDFLKEAERYL
jgi:hypothetical protein